jgi:hypothetical protein
VRAADVLPIAEAIIWHEIFTQICENKKYTKILKTSALISGAVMANFTHVAC